MKIRALFLLGVIALASAPANAAQEAVAVFSVVVGGGSKELTHSTILGDVTRAATMRRGLRVMSSEEAFTMATGSGERFRDCGADEACLAERARRLGARHALLVVVQQNLDPPLVALRLIDARGEEPPREAARSLGPDEGTLSGAIERRAAQLFQAAGYPISAQLVLSVEPAHALIVLQAEDNSAGPIDPGPLRRVTVDPGRYRVRAMLDGFVSQETLATAAPGESVQVELRLQPEPTSWLASPWLWGAVGVVVASAVTTAVLIQTANNCVCVGSMSTSCVGC